MKTIILTCTLTLFSFFSTTQAQDFEQPASAQLNDAQHPCITPETYKIIEKEIAANRKLLGLSTAGKGPQTLTPLAWPLRPSTSLHDCSYYFVAAYVDHDATSAFKDYNCGTNTYNGHTGTDIAISPFPFYKMENHQVEVVAAAAGTIIGKHDGEYDRNCVGAGSSLVANDIIIQHADGSVALYWHMKDSLTTKTVGQTVAGGEYLGIVGSSGSSSGAHLHFEVWAGTTASTLIDPFSGTCNLKNSSSWWIAQKPHAEPAVVKASVHITDIATPPCPTTETPNESTSYIQPFQGPGLAPGYAKFYAFVRNGIAGQSVNMTILNPDNTVFNSWSYNLTGTYNFGYLGFSKKLPLTAGTYTFNATYNGITCTKSFDILTTLPVSLTWFKGEARHGSNQLLWQTLTENDNLYFSIEKSPDGESFTEISKVKAAGTTSLPANYSYSDGNNIDGLFYYRLRQVNRNGSYTYSNIISLRNNNKHPLFNIYPNPATTLVQLQFSKALNGKVNMVVSDVAGKVVMKKKLKGNGSIVLITDKLSAGTYVVKVENNGEQYSQSLVIIK